MTQNAPTLPPHIPPAPAVEVTPHRRWLVPGVLIALILIVVGSSISRCASDRPVEVVVPAPEHEAAAQPVVIEPEGAPVIVAPVVEAH